jgi:uncharacterized protein (TIGR01244 family)
MTQFLRLDDRFSVAPQISPDDLTAAAREGFVTVVCNRPDGEAPGQPASAEMAAKAGALGMAFVALPFVVAAASPEQVAALAAAMRADKGPILGYCRSGTRSTILWAAASVALGAPFEEVAAKAAGAGYDIAPHEGLIARLAAAAS